VLTCELCKQNNASGFCGVCRRPACDQCGKPCIECGKTTCKDHTRKTKSGKVMCERCAKSREAPQKKESDVADLSFEALRGEMGPLPETAPHPDEEREARAAREGLEQPSTKAVDPTLVDDHRPILTASAYRPPSHLRNGVGLLILGGLGIYFFATSSMLRSIVLPFGNQRNDSVTWILFGIAWGVILLFGYSVWLFVTTLLRDKGIMRSKYQIHD